MLHVFTPEEPAILGKLSRMLDFTTYSNDAIASALAAHPDADMSGCFEALFPPDAMLMLDSRVYRHHAHELALRFATGLDIRTLTDAELLVVVSQASLDAPLNAPHARLFHVLYEEVMGNAVCPSPPEMYPGQTDELRTQYKRKKAIR